jgi:hypothetical protein
MIFSPIPGPMSRIRVPLLLTALFTLTACTTDLPSASADDAPATVSLTVTGPAVLTSLGDTVLLRTQVGSRAGTPTGRDGLRWTVEPAGIIEAVGPDAFRAVRNGRVTIVASIDPARTGVRPAGYWAERTTDTVTIEVRQRAVSLTLAPVDTLFTTVGAMRTIAVSVRDARGHLLEDAPPPAWLTADPRIVTVDASGAVRSAGEGSAQVTVQVGGLTGSLPFTVRPRLPHTSCMVYARRGASRESCVTLGFVLRERAGGVR